MKPIRYSFDSQGRVNADGRTIATDIPTNPDSGPDLRDLVARANAAPELLRVLKAIRAELDGPVSGWWAGGMADLAMSADAVIAKAEGKP